MKFSPLPIYGGSYADDTLSWSAQDCLGWIPSNAETPGTKTPGMFKTPPGLRPFAEIEPGGGARPVRGAWNAEGKAFVVIGTTMYQLSNSGVFIPLGTIPGTGRVIFSHNQVSLGNQVLAVNGSAGYIYDTRNGVFQRITDPGYPGAFVSTFIDGYFVQISTNRRFAFNSDVANGLEYNTLDRFTSEFSPDLLVSLVASNNELFLLSETSGEFFENTGASQQPFRSKRITMDRGCAGAYTVAKADNTVFWLGNNGYFYVLNGYAPQRISTRAIEQSILNKNWKQAFAFAWEDAGHTVIYWTFPDGLTWGYDTSTGLWHRRESYGLNRWRVNTMTFWNQEWYAGDFQYGRMWKMDWDYILEGDQEFPSERTTAVIHDNQNRIIIPRLELLMQVGQEETIPVEFPEQPPSPSIEGAAPDGSLALAYSGYAYTISGGTGLLTVTLRSGALPPGLTIDSLGEIDTGIPEESGSFTFTLRVTDENGLWDELTDTILITAPSYITTGSDDVVYTSTPYNWTINVNVGESTANSLIESRNGKVFAFHNDNSGASVSSNGGGSWSACSGLPAAMKIVALVYADSTYIAVPTSGTDLYVSTDGVAFSARSYAAGSELTTAAIAIDDLVIVARSNSSQSRRSTDGGNTWADCNLVSTTQIWAFANSPTSIMCVQGGSAPALRRSTDNGITWSSIANPLPGDGLASISYGNGIYLVINGVGDYATSADDGLTWTVRTSLPENLGGVGQGNEMVFDGTNFIVCGSAHLFTTPGVPNWTQRNNISAAAIAFYREGQ